MNMVKSKTVRPFIRVKTIPLKGRATVKKRYLKAKTSLPSNPPAKRCSSASPPSAACTSQLAVDEHEGGTSTSKKQGTVEAWARTREILLSVRLELFCPSENPPCAVCGVSLTTVSDIWRCNDCGSETYYCEGCVKTVHQGSAVMHGLEKWEEGEFHQKVPVGFRWHLTRKDGHQCETFYARQLNVFDQQGRLHDVWIQFCNCEVEVASLVRYGLWPASVKQPQTAISMTLLDLVCRLQLECGASLKAICAAIQCSPVYSKCHDLYGILINESYEEYRHWRYQMSTLRYLGPDITDGTHCPLCPENGCLVVAVDGLFGLPRKKSSGSSLEAPKHFNRFFSPQDDVDAFNREKQHSSEQGCVSFQAGNALRSKVKNSKLDETGVFGLCCKHEHPRRFLSLKRGESLSNAAYLLKELREQFGTNKEIVFMYDIACKLKPHLQKYYPDLLTKTTFAVPAFHAYGHDVACQISYSCRNVEGAGLADGEQLERLWSYLRRFGKVTKEMTPSHRVDLLTDALLHYSSKIRKSQAKALVLKATKVKSVEEQANAEVAEIMKNTGLTQQDIQVWTNEYHTEAKRSVDWTWEEVYVQNLIEHRELQILSSVAASRTCDIVTRLDKLEKKMKTIEKQHGLGERWILTSESCLHIQSAIEDKKRHSSLQAIYRLVLERRFLCGLVRKYAEGQKIAIRLSRKISSVCQKIRQKVNEFNIATGAVNQPHALEYTDVIQIDNPIWSTLTTGKIDNMPVKQQLFVLWNTVRRANEEKAYLVEECKSGKMFYEKQISEIDRHSQPEGYLSNRQDRGTTAALQCKRREFSRFLSEFSSLLTTLTTGDCDVNSVIATDSDTDEEVEDVENEEEGGDLEDEEQEGQ